jgi:hypothetical protein
MAAIKRIERTSIDGWKTFDVGENFGVYLIAIKGIKTDDDIMSIDELKNVVVEIGIDSGIPDSPIAIQRVNLQFNNSENKSVALGMTSKLPKDNTYIRVVAFSNGMAEKLEGSMPISINTVTII